MIAPVISIGNPRDAGPAPTIVHAWIVQNRDGLSLVMKADADCSDQRVIDIRFTDDGAVIVARNLFASRLCGVFQIEKGDAPAVHQGDIA